MSDLAWVFEAPKASAARVFEAPSVSIVSSAFGPMKLQNAFQAPGRSKSTDIEKKDGDQEENDMATTSTTMKAELLAMLEDFKTKDEKKFDFQGYFRGARRKLLETSSTAEEMANALITQLNSDARQASALVSREDAKNMANAILDKKVETDLGEAQATIKEAIVRRTAMAFEPFMAASLEAYSQNKELLEEIMHAKPTTLTELTPAKLQRACFQAKHLYNWNLVWYYILKNLKDWVENKSQTLPENQVFKQVLRELNKGKDTFESVHSQLVEDYAEFEKEREIETKTGVLSWSMDFVENIDDTTEELQEELSKITEGSSMTLVKRRHKLMDKMLGNLVTDTPCQPVQSITPHTAILYTVIQAQFDEYEDGSLSDSESPEFQSWLSAFDLVTHWNHLAAKCKTRMPSIDNRTSTSPSPLIPAIPAISMYRKNPSNKRIIVQALQSEYNRMVDTLILDDDEHMDDDERKGHKELVDLFRTVAAFEAEVREMDDEADEDFQVQLGERSELLKAFKQIDEYERADTVKRQGTADGKIQFVELHGFLTRKHTDEETDILKKVRKVLREKLDPKKGDIQSQISHLFHKVMDLDNDSHVDPFEFLRYMVLAMHSHPHLQDDLEELTTVTGHLMDHSEVFKNIAEKQNKLHEEFENYEGILKRLDEFFYNPKKWRSQNATMLQELEQFTQMFNNGIKFCNLVKNTYVDVNSSTNIQKKTDVFKVLNTYMNDVISTILKPILFKAIVHTKQNVPVIRDKNEKTKTELLLQEQIEDMSKQTKQFMSLLNEMRKSEVSIDSTTALEEALKGAGQVEDEMANFNLTQQEVSAEKEQTKQKLVDLQEQVEKIVTDTTQSPSKKEDLEEKIKELNVMDTRLQAIATAIATDETDTHEETEKLKESIKDQIQQERAKREEEIADIKAKEEATANAQRQAEQEKAEKKAREAQAAQAAQEKFDTETGEITSEFNRVADKIENDISQCKYPYGNLHALKAQVEQKTKKLEELKEKQLQRFTDVSNGDGGQFDKWPDRIADITTKYKEVEKQFENDVKAAARTLQSQIKELHNSIETSKSSWYLKIFEDLLKHRQQELKQKTELASANYKQFESLFDEAWEELDSAQAALTVAKERLESEKVEEAKRLQEAEDEKQRAAQAQKEAEDAKVDFDKKSNENEGKFFELAYDIREAIRDKQANLDQLKSQLDDALPQLEQLLKDQTALYSNAREQFHFADGWRGNIDDLETNYVEKLETFQANMKYTTEDLANKIKAITSQLALLQDKNMTADELASLVSKLEGKFQAIREEIQKEEAKATKISKDAAQYFSSIHKQFKAAKRSFETTKEVAEAEMKAKKRTNLTTASRFEGSEETDKPESASSNNNPKSTRRTRGDIQDVEFDVPKDTVEKTGDKEGGWFRGKTSTTATEKPAETSPEKESDSSKKSPEKESDSSKKSPEKKSDPPEKSPEKKSDPPEKSPEKKSDPPETLQDVTPVVHSLGFMERNGFRLLSGYAEHYLSHVKYNDLKNLELYECDGVYLWYANDKTRTPAWNLLALMNTLLTKYNGWDCSGRCWRISTGARRAQRLFSPWSSYGRMAQVLSGERQAHHQGVTGNFQPLELLHKAFGENDQLNDDLQRFCSVEALKHVKNPQYRKDWLGYIISKVEPLVSAPPRVGLPETPRGTVSNPPTKTSTKPKERQSAVPSSSNDTPITDRIKHADTVVISAGYSTVERPYYKEVLGQYTDEFNRLESWFGKGKYVGIGALWNDVKSDRKQAIEWKESTSDHLLCLPEENTEDARWTARGTIFHLLMNQNRPAKRFENIFIDWATDSKIVNKQSYDNRVPKYELKMEEWAMQVLQGVAISRSLVRDDPPSNVMFFSNALADGNQNSRLGDAEIMSRIHIRNQLIDYNVFFGVQNEDRVKQAKLTSGIINDFWKNNFETAHESQKKQLGFNPWCCMYTMYTMYKHDAIKTHNTNQVDLQAEDAFREFEKIEREAGNFRGSTREIMNKIYKSDEIYMAERNRGMALSDDDTNEKEINQIQTKLHNFITKGNNAIENSEEMKHYYNAYLDHQRENYGLLALNVSNLNAKWLLGDNDKPDLQTFYELLKNKLGLVSNKDAPHEQAPRVSSQNSLKGFEETNLKIQSWMDKVFKDTAFNKANFEGKNLSEKEVLNLLTKDETLEYVRNFKETAAGMHICTVDQKKYDADEQKAFTELYRNAKQLYNELKHIKGIVEMMRPEMEHDEDFQNDVLVPALRETIGIYKELVTLLPWYLEENGDKLITKRDKDKFADFEMFINRNPLKSNEPPVDVQTVQDDTLFDDLIEHQKQIITEFSFLEVPSDGNIEDMTAQIDRINDNIQDLINKMTTFLDTVAFFSKSGLLSKEEEKKVDREKQTYQLTNRYQQALRQGEEQLRNAQNKLMATLAKEGKDTSNLSSIDNQSSNATKKDEFLADYNLFERRVLGDGRCLYWALQDQLFHRFNETQTVMDIRENVVQQKHKELEKDPESYFHAMEELISDNFDIRMRNRTDITWSHPYEIDLFAKAYNMNVIVYDNIAGEQSVYSCDTNSSRGNLFIAYNDHVHYNSLLPKDGKTQGRESPTVEFTEENNVNPNDRVDKVDHLVSNE